MHNHAASERLAWVWAQTPSHLFRSDVGVGRGVSGLANRLSTTKVTQQEALQDGRRDAAAERGCSKSQSPQVFFLVGFLPLSPSAQPASHSPSHILCRPSLRLHLLSLPRPLLPPRLPCHLASLCNLKSCRFFGLRSGACGPLPARLPSPNTQCLRCEACPPASPGPLTWAVRHLRCIPRFAVTSCGSVWCE